MVGTPISVSPVQRLFTDMPEDYLQVILDPVKLAIPTTVGRDRHREESGMVLAVTPPEQADLNFLIFASDCFLAAQS